MKEIKEERAFLKELYGKVGYQARSKNWVSTNVAGGQSKVYEIIDHCLSDGYLEPVENVGINSYEPGVKVSRKGKTFIGWFKYTNELMSIWSEWTGFILGLLGGLIIAIFTYFLL